MQRRPQQHVSLGVVWEQAPPHGEQLMARIEEEFQACTLQVYGLRAHRQDGISQKTREPVLHPIDYEIDWIGLPPTGLCEHEPCARRRAGEFSADRRDRDTDVFINLTVTAEDWGRICRAALPTDLLDPFLSVAPSRPSPRKPRRDGKRNEIIKAMPALISAPD